MNLQWHNKLFFIIISIILCLPTFTFEQTCNTPLLIEKKAFATCLELPHLSSSLHWTYDASNSTLSIAFIAPPEKPGGWVSWGINPTATGMAGTQALLAFRHPHSRGGGRLSVATYNISMGPVVPSPIAFETWGVAAAEDSGGTIQIYGNWKLPPGVVEVNQVWQVGPSVTGRRIDVHAFAPENLNAKGKLNLQTGQSSATGVDSPTGKKKIHGLLNALGWGILLPIGAITARYLKALKPEKPTWFYLHVACQLVGYAGGTAGWVTGLKLGDMSKGIAQYPTHRNLGIAIFSLATLQVLALFLRPKKENKYRPYWNVYHHGVGYVVIIIGVINVFEGFSILNLERKWVRTYIAVISALAVFAAFLEVVSWLVVGETRSEKMEEKISHSSNGDGGGFAEIHHHLPA